MDSRVAPRDQWPFLLDWGIFIGINGGARLIRNNMMMEVIAWPNLQSSSDWRNGETRFTGWCAIRNPTVRGPSMISDTLLNIVKPMNRRMHVAIIIWHKIRVGRILIPSANAQLTWWRFPRWDCFIQLPFLVIYGKHHHYTWFQGKIQIQFYLWKLFKIPQALIVLLM